MTDTQIIDLFFARSEQAITALSDQYGGLLRRTAAALPERLSAPGCFYEFRRHPNQHLI